MSPLKGRPTKTSETSRRLELRELSASMYFRAEALVLGSGYVAPEGATHKDSRNFSSTRITRNVRQGPKLRAG